MSAEATFLLSSEERRVVRLCLIVLGTLTVGTWVGIATSPYLVNNYPLLLIGISPVSRHMVLVAPIVGPLLLVLVGGSRTLAFTTFSYLLGRSLGEPGIVWLEQRAEKAGRFVRWLQRFFDRFSYFAVFVFPMGAMAAIAGMARMRPLGFFCVALAGIVFRLSLLALVASSLREPIMLLLEFIRTWQAPATVVCIVGVGVYQYIKWRRRQPRAGGQSTTGSAESGRSPEGS